MKIMRAHTNNSDILSAIKAATANQRPLIELTAGQKEALKSVAGAALAVIATAGVVMVAAVAPNVFQAIYKINRFNRGKRYSFKEKQLKTAQAFYYLKRRGLIELTNTPNGLWAKLTNKGRYKMEQLHFDTLRIKPTKQWDGKWWIVAADIPTKDYRWAADLFRKKIKQMGFYSLQRTLWFYPYCPVGEIQFVVQRFKIANFVTVMEVSRMEKEDEVKLKKFFNL